MNIFNNLVATSILSLSLFFTGCSTTAGNPNLVHMTSNDLSSHLIKGKSTKAEVTAYLGEPISKITNDGSEYWSYSYGKASGNALSLIPFVGFLLQSVTVNSTSVQVEFNGRGIVKNYSTSQMGTTVR